MGEQTIEIIAETLRELVASQFLVDEQDISDATHFRTDLNADDLDIVELAIEAEEAFGIEIPDSDDCALETFGEMVLYIGDRIGLANAA